MSEEEKKPAADQPGDGENEKRAKGNRNRFPPSAPRIQQNSKVDAMI
jgi:hypothetical protein